MGWLPISITKIACTLIILVCNPILGVGLSCIEKSSQIQGIEDYASNTRSVHGAEACDGWSPSRVPTTGNGNRKMY